MDFDLTLYNLAPSVATSKHESRKSVRSFGNGKAKASTSAAGLLLNATTEPKVPTSLAISFSSPNLATNTSFSSSSESDYEQIEQSGACTESMTKINHFLEIEDASSIDDNDAIEDEGISGENDVEYAELTQRMIPPVLATQKTSQNGNQHRGDEQMVDEMMLLSLFDDSGASNKNVGPRASTSSSSSSSLLESSSSS